MRRPLARLVFACAVATGTLPVAAATFSVPFLVTVQVGNAAQQAVLCTRTEGSGAFAATVTIVCKTGAVVDIRNPARLLSGFPSEGGTPGFGSPAQSTAFSYRQLSQVVRDDVVLGTVDSDLGNAQLTQWRIIESRDRSFTEVGVSW